MYLAKRCLFLFSVIKKIYFISTRINYRIEIKEFVNANKQERKRLCIISCTVKKTGVGQKDYCFNLVANESALKYLNYRNKKIDNNILPAQFWDLINSQILYLRSQGFHNFLLSIDNLASLNKTQIDSLLKYLVNKCFSFSIIFLARGNTYKLLEENINRFHYKNCKELFITINSQAELADFYLRENGNSHKWDNELLINLDYNAYKFDRQN